MKKALLYTPYLDVMGGGERHILAIMSVIAEHGYSVDIAWDDPAIVQKMQSILSIDTKPFTIIPNFIKNASRGDRTKKTSEYDIVLYVTDGSYFESKAKNSYIFVMYPERKLFSRSPLSLWKRRGYSIFANGQFTADIVSKWIKKDVEYIYPYFESSFFYSGQGKKNIILTVGRIFGHLHSKRQDVAIQAFIKLKKEQALAADYTLVVAGGLKDEDTEYMQRLRALAQGRDDIRFEVNISFEKLQSLYREAKIYWHCAGYGVDENKDPQLVEHVGITPIEAMASRCLVYAYDAGGPKRMITSGTNGFLFSSVDDLLNLTTRGISELQKSEKILDNAQEFVSSHFSYPVFKNKVEQYFRLT